MASLDMLRSRIDFAALQTDARSRLDPLLVLRYRRNGLERTRFGISTGRRTGTAVVRNTIRRRLRRVMTDLLAHVTPGWDVLVIARPAAAQATPGRSRPSVRAADAPGRSTAGGAVRVNPMKLFGVGMIRLYRVTFFWMPSSCRFEPIVLALYRAGDPEIRTAARQLDGCPAHRPLPPVGPGGLRPCPLRLAGARCATR